MSCSGFENENKIIKGLHHKRFEDLNTNLQILIKDSFKRHEGIINCTKQAGQNKSDLKITIDNESHTYSIKCGSGNSVHQEPVEQFITFLEQNFNITENIKNNIRFFIWGDGTYNGHGEKSKRLGVNELKKNHSKVIHELKTFFNSIKDDLIQRFVFNGASCSKFNVEFIYFGTDTQGVCCSSNEAFNLISNNTSSRATIPVGILSFQAWNRALNNNTDLEKRRGVIQLKIGTLEKLIKNNK